MSFEWARLDQELLWRKRRGMTLHPKLVHEITQSGKATWRVLAMRGTRRPGNKDLVAIVVQRGSQQPVSSFKDILGDVLEKCAVDRKWMMQRFMPALIRVVVLGQDPSTALIDRNGQLPGWPPEILLNVLQVIALSESRKYGRGEPFGGRYLPVRLCAGVVWGIWGPENLNYGVLEQNAVAVLRALTGVREPTLGLVLAGGQAAHLTLTPKQLHALSL
jgi:hypothetical protein